MKENKITISICMGSSCYPRGNGATLQKVKEFIAENHLENKIDLRGNLCNGHCNKGPNVTINGKLLNKVTEVSVIEILKNLLNEMEE